jgi:hypothetical protein
MLDAEWIEVKAKVIADLNAAKEGKLLYICKHTHKKLNPWLLLNQKTPRNTGIDKRLGIPI